MRTVVLIVIPIFWVLRADERCPELGACPLRRVPSSGTLSDMDDVIDRVKADIRDGPRGRLRQIAEESGVNAKTLRNLIYGVTSDMRHANARKLMEFYAQNERRSGLDRRRA